MIYLEKTSRLGSYIRRYNILLRKILAIGIALFVVGSLSSCAMAPEASAPGPEKTPEPTPEPTKVLAVADVKDAEEFFSGIRPTAQAEGWELIESSGIMEFSSAVEDTDAEGIIAYITSADTDRSVLSDAKEAGTAVCVMDVSGGAPVKGAYTSTYDDSTAAALAMQEALIYPPHDTPVRLLAMISTEAGLAEYEKGLSEGKIMPKDTFVTVPREGEEAQADPEAWLSGMLDRYIEGMIDGLYTDNAEFALLAVKALSESGRSDFEVFSSVLTPELKAAMAETPELIPVCIGADIAAAANAQAGALKAIMAGETPDAPELLPTVHKAE